MKVRNKIKNINKLSFAISLIISIAAWFYVVYNVNPTMSRNFRNIPVTITGEDILEENGLAVASIDVESIDVTLRAKRSILDSVKDGSIVISADVSEAGKGDNKFALEISSPSGTVITKQSKKNVVITIENLKTKKVDVRELIALPFEERAFGIAILYQGIGCSLLAFFLSNIAIAKIGVNRTSSFIGISTVTSIIAGVVFLHESFTIYQLIGAVIIIIGVYVANAKIKE